MCQTDWDMKCGGRVLIALFSVNGVTKNWASYITRI